MRASNSGFGVELVIELKVGISILLISNDNILLSCDSEAVARTGSWPPECLCGSRNYASSLDIRSDCFAKNAKHCDRMTLQRVAPAREDWPGCQATDRSDVQAASERGTGEPESSCCTMNWTAASSLSAKISQGCWAQATDDQQHQRQPGENRHGGAIR